MSRINSTEATALLLGRVNARQGRAAYPAELHIPTEAGLAAVGMMGTPLSDPRFGESEAPILLVPPKLEIPQKNRRLAQFSDIRPVRSSQIDDVEPLL